MLDIIYPVLNFTFHIIAVIGLVLCVVTLITMIKRGPSDVLYLKFLTVTSSLVCLFLFFGLILDIITEESTSSIKLDIECLIISIFFPALSFLLLKTSDYTSSGIEDKKVKKDLSAEKIDEVADETSNK